MTVLSGYLQSSKGHGKQHDTFPAGVLMLSQNRPSMSTTNQASVPNSANCYRECNPTSTRTREKTLLQERGRAEPVLRRRCHPYKSCTMRPSNCTSSSLPSSLLRVWSLDAVETKDCPHIRGQGMQRFSESVCLRAVTARSTRSLTTPRSPSSIASLCGGTRYNRGSRRLI